MFEAFSRAVFRFLLHALPIHKIEIVAGTEVEACAFLDPDVTYLQPRLSILLLAFGLYDDWAVLYRVEDDDYQRITTIGLQIVEDLDVGDRVEVFFEYRRNPRLIEFGGIRNGVELFVFGISAYYNVSLQRGLGVRNSLDELDEIKPVIEVIAGYRRGSLKLVARVLDALADERLNFG
jgi:hypothetical protein